VQSFDTAIRLDPKLVEAHVNLGRTFLAVKKPFRAIEACDQALKLGPGNVAAQDARGRAYRMIGQLDQAAADFRSAVRDNPNNSQLLNNLGNTLKDAGDLDAALDCFRRAMAITDSSAAAHSNLICTMHFHPAFDMASLHREQRLWNERFAKNLSGELRLHDNDPDPNRRLRIGFVSPDFCDHCQSLFTIPLLRNLDHGQFEMFGYSNVLARDAVTDQIEALFDHWRNISAFSDFQAAEVIRSDRIDVLLDLTMHMHRNRLLVFARKPAPVQCSWLAYPGSTGLDAIDYRLTDPYLDPEDSNDEFYSEKSTRLPDTFWCYDPRSQARAFGRPPAKSAGHVTFGCLNNFCKINPGVLELWSRVLALVSKSRLILLSGQGEHRQRVLDLFQSHGVEPARIEFVSRLPREQYLELYNRIDVGLDSVPYNAHTTALDAMWMGVPTVTLVGKTVVGRAGLSQLSNIGLTDLVAREPDELVKIAVELAEDVDRLAQLRATLRQRMESSPLMDGPRFARNVESAFRAMWRNWCDARV
jgi:predicted O-linked N-acetylglucosamine transferase (SPINDLY family)